MFTNLSLVGLFTSMFTYVDMGGKMFVVYFLKYEYPFSAPH